jgi:alkylhydroperoxidase family enzyme
MAAGLCIFEERDGTAIRGGPAWAGRFKHRYERSVIMPRVPYVNREDLRPEDRDIYDGLVAGRGAVSGLFRVLAHTPGPLRRLVEYSKCLRTALKLDPVLRELATMVVALHTGVDYEFTHHWEIARRAGVTEDKLRALGEYARSPVFSKRERAVMGYSAEATRAVRVSDATFEELRAALDTQEIVELVQVVAYYNMVARILEPLGVGLESGRAPIARPRAP